MARPEWSSSPLGMWLRGQAALPPVATLETLRPDLTIGGFLGLERRLPLHDADQVPAQSLEDSWKTTREFLDAALKAINSSEPGWLGNDEAEDILRVLGAPPSACLPIYIMSVRSGGVERAVYVGKTSSGSSRFAGGHDAFRKLLAPTYDGMEKWLYLGAVMLLKSHPPGPREFGFNSYLPLEWVSPLTFALALLRSIEAALIYQLQPELNVQHRDRFRPDYEVLINVENHVDGGFLHGHQISPVPTPA